MRSAVYRLWVHRSGSGNVDAYLGPRRMGDEFKVSLHESRSDLPARGHIAISEGLREVVALPDRFLSIWSRTSTELSIDNEFHLIFPTSELALEPSGDDDFEEVAWLAAAPEGGALEVIVLSGPASEHCNITGANAANLLVFMSLAEGRMMWVLSAVHQRMPPEVVSQIERTKAVIRTRKPDFSIGAPILDEPGTRVLLGMGREGRPIGWIEVSFSANAGAA